MPEQVMAPESLKRISGIHCLSKEYNNKVRKDHSQRLLELMEKHVAEIRDLKEAQNKHFLVETGDLIILCFELLLEHQYPIDDMISRCFGRYETKLKTLLLEADAEIF